MAKRSHRPRRDRRARATVVEPPWIKDPSLYPFAKVITDSLVAPINRVFLTVSQLTQQLQCPRHLVNELLKTGGIHEASAGEKRAGLGLCPEDLASLAIGAMMVDRYNLPMDERIRAVVREVRQELLQAPNPLRVILGIFRGNQGIEPRICTNRGTLDTTDIPPDQLAHTDFFDCSKLRNEIDTAMEKMPLALPTAGSCRVVR